MTSSLVTPSQLNPLDLAERQLQKPGAVLAKGLGVSRTDEAVGALLRTGPFEAPRLEAQYPRVRARRTDGSPLDLLNFSSYNYLGLGYHPSVIAAAREALERYGLGAPPRWRWPSTTQRQSLPVIWPSCSVMVKPTPPSRPGAI